MLRLHSTKGVRFCDGLTRRDFMRVGAVSAGAVGLTLSDMGRARAAGSTSSDINCILLFLVGGPSHLDTFDLKPHAPDHIRGPFRPIQTNVPGMQIGEHFPLMARMAEKYALIRSVHHYSAPIHETGHQLMQTGRLFRAGQEYPHYGAVVSHLRGPRNSLPPFVVLPQPIGNTGVSISHGQSSGLLGPRHEAVVLRGQNAANGFHVTDIAPQVGVDPARLHSRSELVAAIDDAQRAYDAAEKSRETADDGAYHFLFAQNVRRAYELTSERDELRQRYGRNTFGQSCLLARRLVEHGVRLVTVNMFDSVFNQLTWDCHADGGTLPVTLDDYKETLCPMFDAAYSALLEDLAQRGMLRNTLVLAMGEFGRTPQLNPRGGRDHWPGVWSVLFAGAGVRGGQVIGASDRTGAEPRERPVTPADIAASVYHGLGIDPATRLPGPDGKSLTLTDASPVQELFC
jgi:uncharacterized protein DUF1501